MSMSTPKISGKKKVRSVKRKKSLKPKKNKRRYVAPPPTKKRTGDRVDPDIITLIKGKGSPKNGGMLGGFFWHIFHQDVRAGKIFINFNKDTEKADIKIFINQKSQGKGIGKVAYKKACEESNYSKIYASMRKDNIASIRAAVAAGFEEIPSTSGQMSMLWQKK
ncbi:GNAT family N-acetyltransferase [Desulforegula conservatrix]|uniref:GNAT family N-acetyltransferase n=1 Tax=Desulforegula conservatrix TaxID=153026 RepID=UPI0004285C45|nr:GNAT family N-acetyltransferase [Desulforegula conservatrix]